MKILKNEGGEFEVRQFLSDFLVHKKRYTNYYLLNTEGEIVFSTDRSYEGKMRTTESYFVNSLKGTYVEDFFYDPLTAVVTMIAGTPIKDRDGTTLGVLAAKVDIDEVAALLEERSGMGETGESLLVNSDNIVLTELLKEPGSATVKTIFNPQLNSCLSGNSFFSEGIDYAGDAVYGYYRWFPELKSCIASEVDVREALSDLQNIFTLIASMTAALGIILALVGLWLGNRLFKPLQILSQEAKKVKEGDFDVKVYVHSNDEVEEGAVSFNEMASELKKSYSNLENKVKEKTKELEGKLEELETMNELMVGRELKMIELKEKLSKKKDRD